MNIKTHKFSKKEKTEFKNFIDQQIIKKPTPNLNEIYEKRILLDHSYLRAEKYDSPEHQETLKKIQQEAKNDTVPRHQQNPNFDVLIKHIETVNKSTSLESCVQNLQKLRTFVGNFGFRKFPPNQKDQEWIPSFLNLSQEEMDPRLFEQEQYFDHFMNYLLTKLQFKFHEQEFKTFLKLTNSKLDDESSHQCIDQLRLLRNNLTEYQETVNQIFEAIEIDHQYTFSETIAETKAETKAEKTNQQTILSTTLEDLNQIKNIDQFMDYFYSTQS